MNQEYDKNYFEKTAEDAGLILKERRPLWRRWVKIIQKYKASGKLLDVGCGPGFFLAYAERYYDAHGIDISEYAIKEAKYRTKS
jgi:SAM-dependent methyltransferase